MAIGFVPAVEGIFMAVTRLSGATNATAGILEELALTGESMARENRKYVTKKAIKTNELKLKELSNELKLAQESRKKALKKKSKQLETASEW